MSILREHVTVRPYTWTDNDGQRIPMIRIQSGPVFVMVPYNQARTVVDQVHDLCDDHDRQHRERNSTWSSTSPPNS